MATIERLTRPASRYAALTFRRQALAGVVLVALSAALMRCYAPNKPVDYSDERDHFFYGSIGADMANGLPTRILLVLPSVFPDLLPEVADDYSAFGFLYEAGNGGANADALPIGFSVRRQLIDRSAINCGTCHTGSVRASADAEPVLIAAMPANTVDLLSFFRFLFDAAADHRFAADTLLPAMAAQQPLGFVERLLYRFAIPAMRQGLLERRDKLAFLLASDYPAFGPGRVNTFDTFKFDQFAPYYAQHGVIPSRDELLGVVSFPAVWNQAQRDGMWLHWDGNNDSVNERNFSASLGAGAQPHEVDVPRLLRIEAWLGTLPPPDYPFTIDSTLAEHGKTVYQDYCFSCHDMQGRRVGQVIPLQEIGTDRARMDSYTDFLRQAQIDYTSTVPWTFQHFQKTEGYATQPLDGIWARAPFLHNDSVPTMWDLLTPAAERPVRFGLGSDIYDQQKLGFAASVDGARFVLDTRQAANHNSGHSGAAYGTELSDDDKRALIEYLKTQ